MRVLLGVLIGILIIACLIAPRPRRLGARLRCVMNLRSLGVSLMIYAEEHDNVYPTAERWCDLLVEEYCDKTGEPAEKFRESYRCPQVDEGGWGYAMNPLADRWSGPDVVLLFESNGGWNSFGGPELLAADRHEGRGCNVLFADGRVEFIQLDETAHLRWQGDVYSEMEQAVPPIRNARRPETREEMEYWLQNMIWHHRFRAREVRAATGLKFEAVYKAQEICDVYRSNWPKRDVNAPLLVLPYPGGRHPRIGFLEGAIDPQRETKFSVFAPWDPNSYVVADVPEAIWSNLGLTYLAHTHIDTIWTQKGIELEKLEWNRRADGSLDIERTLPNGIAFGVKARPSTEAVHMEMWLRNGTGQKLTDLRIQNCIMTKMAAGFAEQTNENKVLTNPYVACRSEDGRRWIITAWEGCHRPWGNPDCPCFHSDPKFPDLEPGQTHRLRGWLSFCEGEDIQKEFERIEATGWRQSRKDR